MGDRSAEILAKLDQLLTVTTSLQVEVRGVQSDVGGLQIDVGCLQTEVTGQGLRIDRLERTVSELAHAVDKGFGMLNVRLDEQRQTINALIPTRIAAVPGRADAAD